MLFKKAELPTLASVFLPVGQGIGEVSESKTRIVYKVNLFKFDYRNFRGTFFILCFSVYRTFVFSFSCCSLRYQIHSKNFSSFLREGNINRVRASLYLVTKHVLKSFASVTFMLLIFQIIDNYSLPRQITA